MSHKLIIGCGYLGRRVAKRWLDNGETVCVLTRDEDQAEKFRAMGLESVVGDVTQPESLASLPDADVVLYAVGWDRSAGKSMRTVSLDGLRNVLDRITTTTKRFLYISSTSVYGQTGGEWIDEESPCEPSRENGEICLEAEQRVWAAFPPHDSRRAANVLRLAGIYGPGRMLRRIEAVRSNEPIDGNPAGFLNLIHVDDAARIVDACLRRGQPGRTYLVCDDEPLTRRDYYRTLAELLDAPQPVFHENTEPTPSHGPNKRCCNRRMKQELGVELKYPTCRDGLAFSLQNS